MKNISTQLLFFFFNVSIFVISKSVTRVFRYYNKPWKRKKFIQFSLKVGSKNFIFNNLKNSSEYLLVVYAYAFHQNNWCSITIYCILWWRAQKLQAHFVIAAFTFQITSIKRISALFSFANAYKSRKTFILLFIKCTIALTGKFNKFSQIATF